MARAAGLLVPFLLSSLALVPAAAGTSAKLENRPSDISAAAWLPLTRDLGFVIEQTASRGPDSVPPAVGYFMLRRHGGWLRLDPLPQAARLRWPLRSREVSRWIPIAGSLGFILEAPASERGDGPASAAFGYFVARRGGHALRLDPMAHGALFDGPLTAGRPGMTLPITARLRFVIQQPAPKRRAQLAAALGYFLIDDNSRWLRLNPIGAGELLRQPL